MREVRLEENVDRLPARTWDVEAVFQAVRSRRPAIVPEPALLPSVVESLSERASFLGREVGTVCVPILPVVTSVAEPMRESDVVGCEVSSVHLESRVVVSR